MRRLSAAIASVGVITALISGCGYDETPLPEKPEAESTSPPGDPECTTVDADYASYEPSAEVVPGGRVEAIRKRGSLIVGVSADTYLMASANPTKGNLIEGFDIEFAKAVGRAIFDDPATAANEFKVGADLQYRVITAAQRIPLLQDRTLDLVIRNMTITCDRWDQIAFSQVYYEAAQKVLVSATLDDGDETNGEYHDVHDLAGLRVCAPRGSTSLDNITDEEKGEPEAIVAPADNHTGCLVKFQRGEIDAITGDDTVLAGLAAQDPYAVVPVQNSLSREPYGIAANLEDVDLVKFVNAVLQDMRDRNSWQPIYNEWLKEPLSGAEAVQPPPTQPYREE